MAQNGAERARRASAVRAGFRTPIQPALTQMELEAGSKADFLVYYIRDGRRYLDAIWADNLEEAGDRFHAACEQVGWTVTEVMVVERV